MKGAYAVIFSGGQHHLDTALGNRIYVLAFLEHHTRRLHVTGVTAHPSPDWATQQARNLAGDLCPGLDSQRFLLRDRDDKYSPSTSPRDRTRYAAGGAEGHLVVCPPVDGAARHRGRMLRCCL